MMSSFLSTLLSTSAQAAILVILILLIKKCLGLFLSPQWHFAIWLLLIGRLVFVAGPESHFSIGNLLPSLELSDSSLTPGNTFTGFLPTANRTDVNRSKFSEVAVPADASSTYRFALDFRHLLFGAWLLGTFVVFLVIIRNILQILSIVRRAKSIDDPSLHSAFAECRLELGITKEVRLLTSDEVETPMLAGLVRPSVLLPEKILGSYSPTELKLIFVHELIHLKRRDLLIGLIAAMLQAIHWFNPLVWYGFYRMRIDREIACDAAVINHVGFQRTPVYCRTLINLAEIASSRQQLIGTIGIIEVKSETGKRIIMLSRTQKNGRLQMVVGSLITVFLVGISFTKAQSQPTKETPTAVGGIENLVPTSSSATLGELGIATGLLTGKSLLAVKRPFTLTVDEKIGKLIYTFDETSHTLSSIDANHGVQFIDSDTTISCDNLSYHTTDNKIIANGPGLVTSLRRESLNTNVKVTSDKLDYDITNGSLAFEGNVNIYTSQSDGSVTETSGDKVTISEGGYKMRIKARPSKK